MARILVLFSALCCVSSARRARQNPLGEVLDLLADLTTKIEKDAAAEAASFEEYTVWCNDFSVNRGFDITTAKSQKEKLQAGIMQSSTVIEEASSKIESLAADLAAADTDLKSAAVIRQKEAMDFEAGEKNMVEVIDTLARAVTILDREMQKKPAAFTQIVNGGFKNILQSLEAIVQAASFSSSDKEHLFALVQSQQSVEDQDSEFGAPAAAVYKTQSTNIFEVLEDLKEKAEGQLSELRKAEVNAKHNYAMLKQSVDDQIAADSKDMVSEKASKASATGSKAIAEGDLAVASADMVRGKEALALATANCNDVRVNHETSVKSRDEELKTIAEAVVVLKGSTDGAVGQTYSFVQASTKSLVRHDQVVVFLKDFARKQHSTGLAQLASRIGSLMKEDVSTSADPFVKVRGLIQDMISRLQAQAGSEATEKAYCDDEMAKTSEKHSELSAEINHLTVKLDQAQARSGELRSDVTELQMELATMAKETAEMNVLRQKTHADYKQAKTDLELGLAGVRKAVVILRDYYAQKAEAAGALLQQPVVPAMHTAREGSATSIVGILEVVESDFASNLAKEETTEAEAQDSYESMTQQNKISKATKDSDVKYKTKEIGSLAKAISELVSDRATSSTESDAVLEYSNKLKERCIAKPETYESRKQRRAAEVAGLKDALSILEGEAALVQRDAKVHRHMRGVSY